MPLLSVPAIVLQSFAYSETSKILRLLTPSHGVRSAIARGALRPRSQYGGLLEPFTDGTAMLYLKEGRELQTLSGFELRRSRQALGQDLLRFGAASLLAEIVLRTASEASDPELFDHVSDALDQLLSAPPAELEIVALARVWSMIGVMGFAPILDACLQCGRAVGPEQACSFDYGAGGVRCEGCAAGHAGRAVPPAARAALAALCSGATVPLQRTAAHWRLLSSFLTHHVLEGTPSRAMSFVTEALERRACAS
jgi:DNA repair protein RecO (recombination protein O)